MKSAPFTLGRGLARLVVGSLLIGSVSAQPPAAPTANRPPEPNAAAAAAGAPEIPAEPQSPTDLRRYDVNRYDKIIQKSPFLYKIIPPEPPAKVDPLADFAMTGYSIYEDEGLVTVTLVDKKKNESFTVSNHKENRGMQLMRLLRGDFLKECKAVVRTKDGAEGEVKVEEQFLKRQAGIAGMAAGGAPMGATRGVAPANGAMTNIPGLPGIANNGGNAGGGGAAPVFVPPGSNPRGGAGGTAPMATGLQAPNPNGNTVGVPPVQPVINPGGNATTTANGAAPNIQFNHGAANTQNNQGGTDALPRRRVVLPPPVTQ